MGEDDLTTSAGGARRSWPDFDLASPPVSVRALVYAVLTVPVSLGTARGVAETDKSGTRIFLAFLLAVGVVVVGAEVILVPVTRMLRRLSSERLHDAQERRPSILWAGSAQANGLGSRPGELSLSGEGLDYEPPFGVESFVSSWHGIEQVIFRPKLKFFGKLQIRLHDGRYTSWWVHDCPGAFDTLTNIRDGI